MSKNINVQVNPINDNDFLQRLERLERFDEGRQDKRALAQSLFEKAAKPTEGEGTAAKTEAPFNKGQFSDVENLPGQAPAAPSLLFAETPMNRGSKWQGRRYPQRGYRWSRRDLEQWDKDHQKQATDAGTKKLNLTEGEYIARMPLNRTEDNSYEQWWLDAHQRAFFRTQFPRDGERFSEIFPQQQLEKPVLQFQQVAGQLGESLSEIKQQAIEQAQEISRSVRETAREWTSREGKAGEAFEAVAAGQEKISAKLPTFKAAARKGAAVATTRLREAMPSKEQVQNGMLVAKMYLKTAGRVSLRAGRYAKQVVSPHVVETGKAAAAQAQSIAAPFVPKARAAASSLAGRTKASAMMAAQKPLKYATKTPLIGEEIKAAVLSKTQEKDLVTFTDTAHKAGVGGTVNYVDTFCSDYLGLDMYRPLRRRGYAEKAQGFVEHAYEAPLSAGLEVLRSPGFARFQNVALIILGAIVLRKALQRRALLTATALATGNAVSEASTKLAINTRLLPKKKAKSSILDSVVSMNPSIYGLAILGRTVRRAFVEARRVL